MIIRQLEPSDGYDQFLSELMKNELRTRAEASQSRRIKQTGFPLMKTLDEFDGSRLANVSHAAIHELASGIL